MNKKQERIDLIESVGVKARGKNEILNYLNGKKISARQAILAKCYDCTGYYADGRDDCGLETCPLYPFSPYGTKPVAKKSVSDKQRAEASKRMSMMRSKNAI